MSFQLLLFKDQWDFKADQSFFHLICPNVTPFSCVFLPSLSRRGVVERSLWLEEGLWLSKQRPTVFGSGCLEVKCLPGSLANGTQAWCGSLGSFFSCLFPCLPDRVQSLWIEDTWLARTNDEQQHELWVRVPPNKWEEVFICQVSHTSEHQALCCTRGILCQHSPSCLTSGVGSVYSQY